MRVCLSTFNSKINYNSQYPLYCKDVVRWVVFSWFLQSCVSTPELWYFLWRQEKESFSCVWSSKTRPCFRLFQSFLVENPHKLRLRPFYVKMADAPEVLATNLWFASMFCLVKILNFHKRSLFYVNFRFFLNTLLIASLEQLLSSDWAIRPLPARSATRLNTTRFTDRFFFHERCQNFSAS